MPKAKSIFHRRKVKTGKQKSAEPRCKGVIILAGLFERNDREALKLAKRVVDRCLHKKGWQTRRLGPGARDFLVQKVGKRSIGVGKAWDYVRRLKRDRDVQSAEPALIVPGMELDPTDCADLLTIREKAKLSQSTEDPPLECATLYDWSLHHCKIPEAWRLPLQSQGKRYGEGIIIGHPDTGYTKHYEIWSPDLQKNRLLIESGWNFVEKRQDALDPLTDGWTKHPGHGTATASVVMSDAPIQGLGDAVYGAAPLSKLVPLRVTESVALFDFTALAEAIRFSAKKGHHIISISLGGLKGSDALHRAIQDAVREGVVILAAAGNHVLGYESVVYPAVYDEVIAVAACNCKSEPWKESCSGPEVDITAPGESVWVARTGKEPGHEDDHVAMGSGTSFAVATMAGICALWLAYHGRENLIKKYGAARLASVFKEIIIKHGVDEPKDWEKDKYGAGIVNAKKVLMADLLKTPPAVGTALRASPIQVKGSEIDDFMRYFSGVDRSIVIRGILRLLNTNEEKLGRVLAEHREELLFHIVTNPDVRFVIEEPTRSLKSRRMITTRLFKQKQFREMASKDFKAQIRRTSV